MAGRPTYRAAGAVAAMVLAGLLTGCSGSQGPDEPGGSTSAATPAASHTAPRSDPSGWAEMRKKLDAAESAAAAEEADAASDG